ncbi:MAG: methyltransferase domain-containing protein [Methylothermaceae bacterium]|nr:methyltransferase domain-containing protein [Methylothermaceae bacterium]
MESQDLVVLKDRLRTTWNAGDYGIIARGLKRSAEEFLKRAAVSPGDRMLDVACGAGQLTIPAARSGAKVAGIDIAENWITQARERARTENLDIRFDVGDAEDMPYEDASFDVVVSLIGAMFTPRPEQITSEMARVCRSGGRLIMGNWTPEGFVGKFFATVAAHVPPPEMPSPLEWGKEMVVRKRLSRVTSELQLTRQMLRFDYAMTPSELAKHYLQFFGPTKQAVAALDSQGRAALRDDLVQLWSTYNEATDGTTQVNAEILKVEATLQ